MTPNGPLARHRVTVARNRYQTGTADPRGFLDIAVKGLGHRHQVLALSLKHLG